MYTYVCVCVCVLSLCVRVCAHACACVFVRVYLSVCLKDDKNDRDWIYNLSNLKENLNEDVCIEQHI